MLVDDPKAVVSWGHVYVFSDLTKWVACRRQCWPESSECHSWVLFTNSVICHSSVTGRIYYIASSDNDMVRLSIRVLSTCPALQLSTSSRCKI